MDSAYPGAPRDDVEVKLVEHISCREFLALRGFARDLCTGISRFLADSRENETVSIAMRIKDHGLYLCNYYDRQKSYGTIATADREKTFSNVKWLFRRKLCASHSTGITGLFRTFSQLLHYQVLTDAAGNELLSKMLAILDSQKKSFSSKAGTEYEHFDHEARLRILKTFSATVNMTELAKYFSGNFTTEYQSLSDICGEVCDEEGNLLEEDGCIFRYSIDPCIYFETNKSLIKNVLVNLLVNAYMYNDKEQRQVELILKTEDDRIILSVSDNGNGMTDDVWQAAITPFGTFQKYSSSEALGLALAKCFCDRFDGELSYRSEIGKGTCVTMSFPCDSRGLPKEFHVSRMPPIPNPYGSTYCIMAKGLDPLK